MELPQNIRKEILDYLHLEYGESSGGTGALAIDDIEYEGLFEIGGIRTHYFRYKTTRGHEWATVEPYGDSYCLGITSNTPKPVQKTKIYDHVIIEQIDFDEILILELENWGSGCFGLSDFIQLKLPSGVDIRLLVEVSAHTTPTAVRVDIIDGAQEISAHGYIGLVLNYESV